MELAAPLGLLCAGVWLVTGGFGEADWSVLLLGDAEVLLGCDCVEVDEAAG